MSDARHNTESCMSAIGASNDKALKCSKLASREWIRLGAVAFLWCCLSTLSESSVATVSLQRPINCSSTWTVSFFISLWLTTNPDGVTHVSLSSPLSIALATSFSIQVITAIGPGTTVSMACLTATTVLVRSSLSISTPFSFSASLI